MAYGMAWHMAWHSKPSKWQVEAQLGEARLRLSLLLGTDGQPPPTPPRTQADAQLAPPPQQPQQPAYKTPARTPGTALPSVSFADSSGEGAGSGGGGGRFTAVAAMSPARREGEELTRRFLAEHARRLVRAAANAEGSALRHGWAKWEAAVGAMRARGALEAAVTAAVSAASPREAQLQAALQSHHEAAQEQVRWRRRRAHAPRTPRGPSNALLTMTAAPHCISAASPAVPASRHPPPRPLPRPSLPRPSSSHTPHPPLPHPTLPRPGVAAAAARGGVAGAAGPGRAR